MGLLLPERQGGLSHCCLLASPFMSSHSDLINVPYNHVNLPGQVIITTKYPFSFQVHCSLHQVVIHIMCVSSSALNYQYWLFWFSVSCMCGKASCCSTATTLHITTARLGCRYLLMTQSDRLILCRSSFQVRRVRPVSVGHESIYAYMNT